MTKNYWINSGFTSVKKGTISLAKYATTSGIAFPEVPYHTVYSLSKFLKLLAVLMVVLGRRLQSCSLRTHTTCPTRQHASVCIPKCAKSTLPRGVSCSVCPQSRTSSTLQKMRYLSSQLTAHLLLRCVGVTETAPNYGSPTEGFDGTF